MESHILAGGNKRTCGQRLFNFLLTKFEKDRDYTEFCDIIKMLMDFVYLRANVDKLRQGTYVVIEAHLMFMAIVHLHVRTYVHLYVHAYAYMCACIHSYILELCTCKNFITG